MEIQQSWMNNITYALKLWEVSYIDPLMNFLSNNILLPGKCCILKAILCYEKILLFTKHYIIYWKEASFGQYLLFIFINSTALTCKRPEHSHLKSWPEPLEGSAVSGADDGHSKWIWESKTKCLPPTIQLCSLIATGRLIDL